MLFDTSFDVRKVCKLGVKASTSIHINIHHSIVSSFSVEDIRSSLFSSEPMTWQDIDQLPKQYNTLISCVFALFATCQRESLSVLILHVLIAQHNASLCMIHQHIKQVKINKFRADRYLIIVFGSILKRKSMRQSKDTCLFPRWESLRLAWTCHLWKARTCHWRLKANGLGGFDDIVPVWKEIITKRIFSRPSSGFHVKMLRWMSKTKVFTIYVVLHTHIYIYIHTVFIYPRNWCVNQALHFSKVYISGLLRHVDFMSRTGTQAGGVSPSVGGWVDVGGAKHFWMGWFCWSKFVWEHWGPHLQGCTIEIATNPDDYMCCFLQFWVFHQFLAGWCLRSQHILGVVPKSWEVVSYQCTPVNRLHHLKCSKTCQNINQDSKKAAKLSRKTPRTPKNMRKNNHETNKNNQ